tara:strand:+ start:532 stop:804 length:273 start_codon:yes stop_codon:yes gene_type:complete
LNKIHEIADSCFETTVKHLKLSEEEAKEMKPRLNSFKDTFYSYNDLCHRSLIAEIEQLPEFFGKSEMWKRNILYFTARLIMELKPHRVYR